MTTFVLLAAVLVIAGIALIAIPLLKKKPTEYSPAPWAALIAAGVIAIGSTVMYVRMTNWSWQTKASEDTPQTMVARLARKLEQKRKQNPQRKIPRTELLPAKRFNTDPGTNSVRHISCEPLCLSDFVGVG